MIEYENLATLNYSFENEFQNSFKSFLEKGWYILGEEVQKFEANFAQYCGASYAVGVASGMDALFLSLKAFDFPPGSEVLVPSNTYIATILSILNANLKPVLVEPDIESYNIDVNNIEPLIGTNTAAIMPVHLYGKSCQMDAISEIARKYNLNVIDDAAQAHGAAYKNQKVGGFFSDLTAF